MKLKPSWSLLLVGLAVIGFWLMGSYNGLVQKAQEVDAQWAQVETSYQRRYDLIPNLVEAAKGYLDQEKEILETIAMARQGYAGANTVAEKVEASAQVESALARLLVIIENYPELKSNETIAQVMDELAGTENRVSVERMRYNEIVREYNTRVKSFPVVMIAGMFGFSDKPYFEADSAAQSAPKVDFSN
ncbi:MAG TPA: LemA family protein [Candidatus Woesebacteria bacterium]|nr:LemA family protein [Candidatus Woesebacteria bacterium]